MRYESDEIFGGPKKDASLTKVSSRVRDLKRSASPPLPIRAKLLGDPGKKTSLHESTTIAPHYLHDFVCSACVIVVFY